MEYNSTSNLPGIILSLTRPGGLAPKRKAIGPLGKKGETCASAGAVTPTLDAQCSNSPLWPLNISEGFRGIPGGLGLVGDPGWSSTPLWRQQVPQPAKFRIQGIPACADGDEAHGFLGRTPQRKQCMQRSAQDRLGTLNCGGAEMCIYSVHIHARKRAPQALVHARNMHGTRVHSTVLIF